MAVLYSGSHSQWWVSSTRTCRMYGQCLCNGVKRCIAESFILLISCFLLPRVVKLSRKGCLIIGGLWMILTVVFEVVFSMSAGFSFRDMLVAYNPMTGNLWLLVVLTTFFAPLFVYKIRRIQQYGVY